MSAYLDQPPRSELQAREQIARTRGCNARINGLPVKANPYVNHTIEHAQWLSAWGTIDQELSK